MRNHLDTHHSPYVRLINIDKNIFRFNICVNYFAFSMQVVKTFQQDALGRQVYESTKIIESKINDHYPLNSKNEYNQALIVMATYQKGVHSQEN